jgi:hypothetical protein
VCTARTAPPRPPGRGRRHGRTARASCRRPPRRQHATERQLHRVAHARVLGDLYDDRSPITDGHRESGELGSTSVNPHLGTLGAQRRRQRVGQGCHLGGVGRKQVQILGRSIHQIVGEHRATAGQRDPPACGNPKAVRALPSRAVWGACHHARRTPQLWP